MTIDVLIADDDPLVRTGLRTILEAEPDIAVTGEAVDGAEALAKAGRLAVDVVLMDVRMPRMDGLEATRRLTASSAVRVIVLTTFDVDDHVFDALRAGASGFLLKSAPPAQIVDATRLAAAGEGLIAPSVTQRVIREFADRAPHRAPPAGLAELTERERAVLGLLVGGRSNAEIAADLIIGEATVKTHVTRILAKLQVRDRVQAVILAYETGVVGLLRSGSPGER